MIPSGCILVMPTMSVMLIPPDPLFLITTSGTRSSGLSPMARISSSRTSRMFGLKTSMTTMMRSADLVVERTLFPSPRPLLAPLMMPGMSRT